MYKWIIKNEIAIGSFPTKSEILEMQKNGIRAIVSLTRQKIPEEWIPQSMEYNIFPVDENEPIDMFNLREFLFYTAFLKKVHFPFLLHCKNGLLRSPFFAALYLIYTGKTLNEAVNLVELSTSTSLKPAYITFLKEFNDNITLYYLNDDLTAFYDFDSLIRLLRKQCPWDREQTHVSLIPELIEESLELAEAIKKNDFSGMREELGDVFLQIVLHSVIAEEKGKFSIKDVINEIFFKMYRRHPHVFGRANISKSEEVLKQWEEIKKVEKKNRPVDIAKILAALITSFDVQNEAREAGFDFSSVGQIEEKIEEELEEVKLALKKEGNVSEEIGDLLFSVINLARFLHIDPAHALFLSLEKFRKRFESVKRNSNGKLMEMNAQDKDKLWNNAKKEIQ